MSSKLSAGRYRAKVLYHTMNVNSAGNPELRLSVLPIGGTDNQPLPPGYTATPITIFLTITPGTMEIPLTEQELREGANPKPGWVLQTLRHLGFESEDLTTLDPASDCCHVFTGREIIILGSEDEYKNKKRIRWNIVRLDAEAKKVASGTLAGLSARFAKVLTINPSPPIDGNTPF
jgi:hypothetical protein